MPKTRDAQGRFRPPADDRPAPVRARAFLRAYCLCGGRIVQAAKLSKVTRAAHYKWLQQSRAYREAFERRKRIAGDVYEDELLRRVLEGHLRPVFYQGQPILDKQGKPIGIREYQDHLLLEAVKVFRPEWRTRRIEVTGDAGGPIKVQDFRLDDLSDEELSTLVALLKKTAGAEPEPSTQNPAPNIEP